MVARDGQPLPPFPSRKSKELLAYLLINRRRPQPREHIAALFWGDADADKARHCLNTALWRLRGVLSPVDGSEQPYLRIDAQSIGINTASTFCLDVAEFETRCLLAGQLGAEASEQQADLYRQALTFYQGELLTDCYEDWCLVERERLQGLYLRALSRLTTYHSERREYEDAIASAQRILMSDPLREKVHRALIQLYLASGQQAAALRQYRLCEETVRRELGSEVMPETRALLPRLLGSAKPAPQSNRQGSGESRGTSPVREDGVPELATALVRLNDALAVLDRARAQVVEATALVEEARRRLGTAPAGGAGLSDGATVGMAGVTASHVEAAATTAVASSTPGGDPCDRAVSRERSTVATASA